MLIGIQKLKGTKFQSDVGILESSQQSVTAQRHVSVGRMGCSADHSLLLAIF